MKKTIAMLQNINWDYIWMPENGNKPEEWKAFCRTFKSDVTKALKSLGCTNLKFDNMYFEISVFLTAPDGKMWYIHLSDVRYFPDSVLFRQVKSYKDYTGMANHNTSLSELPEALKRCI